MRFRERHPFDKKQVFSVKLLVRTISFLVLAIVLGAGAFFIASPSSGQAEARDNCVSREVPLDEGYGVTRVELREVCDR